MSLGAGEKSTLRRATNRILHLIARFAPGAMTLRPFLHKLRGVRIYGNVFIGDEVYIENEHPELIEIHDEAQIALRTTIVAHFRGTGRIIIGSKAWIGAGCIIATTPGVTLTVGEAAVIAAGSVVTKDVPPFTMVAGVPAKPIARIKIPMTINTDFNEFKNGLERIS